MSKKITKAMINIPLYDLEPRNVLNTLSKYFKNEKRRFYVGSTHNVEKRKKQHLGVFNSGEMQVVYITEDREKCLSIESTLINALKINKCSPVNKEKKSKIPKENYKEYYVYIMFNDEKIMKSSKKIESGSSKKKIDLPDNESKIFMGQGQKEDLDYSVKEKDLFTSMKNQKELEEIRRQQLFASFGFNNFPKAR